MYVKLSNSSDYLLINNNNNKKKRTALTTTVAYLFIWFHIFALGHGHRYKDITL
jgi:hypothetical protein